MKPPTSKKGEISLSLWQWIKLQVFLRIVLPKMAKIMRDECENNLKEITRDINKWVKENGKTPNK